MVVIRSGNQTESLVASLWVEALDGFACALLPTPNLLQIISADVTGVRARLSFFPDLRQLQVCVSSIHFLVGTYISDAWAGAGWPVDFVSKELISVLKGYKPREHLPRGCASFMARGRQGDSPETLFQSMWEICGPSAEAHEVTQRREALCADPNTAKSVGRWRKTYMSFQPPPDDAKTLTLVAE